MKYEDMTITDFLNLASESSDEMGSLGGGKMVDYETGQYFNVRDEQTAVFIASARNMVEVLCKRLSKANIEPIRSVEFIGVPTAEWNTLQAELESIYALASEYAHDGDLQNHTDLADALEKIAAKAGKLLGK